MINCQPAGFVPTLIDQCLKGDERGFTPIASDIIAIMASRHEVQCLFVLQL